MIATILIGREGSQGFPDKNTHIVLGRPLMEYALQAALNASSVDEVYVSTDSVNIKRIALLNNAQVINRPDYLCTNEALGEDAFIHGYEYIKSKCIKENQEIEFLVLLFCNAPCVLPQLIDEGISILRNNPDYDSVITVSKYNMFSPSRARKIGEDGLVEPFIPFETYPESIDINCDRDSQGDVYFADVCLSIVRPSCLINIRDGILPQKWMGNKIYPIKQWGGLDIDYEWQLPQAEFWLQKNGYTENDVPYALKKYSARN